MPSTSRQPLTLDQRLRPSSARRPRPRFDLRPFYKRPIWRQLNGILGAVRQNGCCALGHRRTSVFRPVYRSMGSRGCGRGVLGTIYSTNARFSHRFLRELTGIARNTSPLSPNPGLRCLQRKAPVFRWTTPKEERYLGMLVDAMKRGQRTDTGWKSQVMLDVIASFQSNAFGVVSKAQLENRRDGVCVRVFYQYRGLC